MSKKQKKAIKDKIDEFVDINTPREITMKLAEELLNELTQDHRTIIKTSVWNRIKIKILNLINKQEYFFE
ncbi:hypothetical protein [Aquimarina mytili]|uniref:Uncharacterized protein n=1 Tax=Aquimarina mytili TaxID=874423 RepID=A0A937DB81_9FLAO|nr:hypothetical protein [Aquimarina mytili]MBL0684328.1 hypothetical protein [Aquimarina mytili]